MKKIGICTGGGDAPGLNAVIRAVVKFGAGKKGWELYGIEECFNGLMYPEKEIWPLTPKSCRGLLHRGGTILGTTNRSNPFDVNIEGRPGPECAKETFQKLGLDGIIVIGGDGTQEIGHRLMAEQDIPVIGVPKTIDNDLDSTDFTFGFWSAVDVATEALDRLHSTAESHDRVMILEVMGRTAGWIALYAGVAGGADCIAIPELPYNPDRFVEKIMKRRTRGRNFTLVIIAEGSKPMAGMEPKTSGRKGAGEVLAALLRERIEAEIRLTVLGHLQRGGSPVPFDRVLATRYGVKAVELVEEGKWGELVCLRNGEMTSTPLSQVTGYPREVDPGHSLIATARAVGIDFGMDP